MSIERQALAASVRSRTAWHRISKGVDPDAFSPYGKVVLDLVSDYYNRDSEAKAVPLGDILAFIDVRFDKSEKHRDLYREFAQAIYGTEVSASNIAELVTEIRRKDIGTRLGTALLNSEKSSTINDLWEQYDSLGTEDEDSKDEVYEGGPVTSLVADSFDESNRIKLLPKGLDKILKSRTKRGHHLLVVARPESGKTCVTLTLARAFALQGLRFILFGNEEPVADTRMRFASCLAGMTDEEILADPAKAQALLDERGWSNVIFIPLTPGTPREINRYLEMYKPDGFSVDQIRNLNVGAETRVNQLEMAATAVRNAAKKYNCLGVSVTQAGDSAHNKLILDMNDVDFSKTGIPAAVDLMLMMGTNDDFNAQGMRMFNLPKNKISAQHVHWPVKINQALSRIEDIE